MRVKKYSEVMAALEKWEQNVIKFEKGTDTKMGKETKIYSLKQLVPEELEMMITSQSNNLVDFASVKKYIVEQVQLRRDKKAATPVPMEVDHLADKILAVARHEDVGEDWSGQGYDLCGVCNGSSECEINNLIVNKNGNEDDDEQSKLASKLEEIMTFVSQVKGKGKGKGCKGKASRDKECWHVEKLDI